MTDLEKTLIEKSQQFINSLSEKTMNEIMEHYPKNVKVPIFIEGVLDYLVFSTEEKRFTKLLYTVGTKGRLTVKLGNQYHHYFDEVKEKELVL